MTVDLVMNRARACLKEELVDCSIAIDDGKIFKVGKETTMPNAVEKMDLENLLVLPGLIDSHVHLRDEGKAYKEDFQTGTAAAAAGGFTTVLDMPNNDPVTMSAETLKNRMTKAQPAILVNVGFFSEFPHNNEEISKIVDQGAVAFKLFMAEQVGGLDIDYDEALYEAFNTVRKQNIPVAVHAEDEAELRGAIASLRNAGRSDIEGYLQAHSESVEEAAVKRVIGITRKTHTHLHVCHVSTAEALMAIAEGKSSGVPVTCETTPHNLLLSSKDLRRMGALALTMPPVRESRHIKALWNGVKSGSVDTLGSDHAPHILKEKTAEIIWNVKVGIPGLETTLPLLLTQVNRKRIAITDLVRLLSENPARIFKLDGKGTIKTGASADLTIVDLTRKYKIDASKFQSKAKYSPFDDWQVCGKPVKTFVGGRLIMDEGKIVAKPGSGVVVRGRRR